jgi:hypothetical protein
MAAGQLLDFCEAGNCTDQYDHWTKRCVSDANCTTPALCGDDNECRLVRELQGWEGSAFIICGAALVLVLALLSTLPLKVVARPQKKVAKRKVVVGPPPPNKQTDGRFKRFGLPPFR